MVYTDDNRPIRDTRWFKTVHSQFMQVDGNRAHRLNRGLSYMAHQHCLASISNHARPGSNATYETPTKTVTPRAILESTGMETQWQCIVLVATEDIHRHHQILADYEPNTGSQMWIFFRNEPLYPYLRNSWAAFRSWRKYSMA